MTKSLGASAIAGRMNDYFNRQIAAFERMLNDLTILDGELDDAQLDALAALQQRHTRETGELAREFRALLNEWQASPGIEAADRAAIGRQARRAEDLAAKVDARCTQGNALVQEKMQSLRASLDEVAAGRDVLNKYRPETRQEPSFLDRKA